MRKIIFILAASAVLMLSCERADNPFEYEITEVFTSRFRISNDAARFLMFDQLTPNLVVEPVNLPERFQQHDIFVQATVGRIGEEVGEHGYPLVKITQIHETSLRGGTFTVSTNNRGEFVLSHVSLTKGGHVHTVPSLNPPIIPINLPEEFQWKYPCSIFRFVIATYYYTGKKNQEGRPIVEIVEIHEFLRKGRFYVKKTDKWGYVLFPSYDSDFRAPLVIPTNLPEEFQVENFHVQVMFILTGFTEEGNAIVEIAEIYEVGTRAQTRRITGGTNTHIRYHPWQVHFTVRGSPWCGGTIIAPNFILTADHCLYNRLTNKRLQAGGTPITERCLRVHAGITCRSEINSSNTFEVERIIRHPQAPNRDVMLIQLSRPIPFNDSRNAINFMASTHNALFGEGSRVTATGWGGTVIGLEQIYNIHSNCLQTVDLTIDRVSANMIEAVGTQGIRQGLCYGDSGGPLTIYTVSNEPILIGVARDIFLEHCRGTNETNPSRFERVDRIVPWIDATMRIFNTTISGSSAVCSGTLNATFSIPPLPPNASVSWTADAPLSITNSNQTSVTVMHTGATTPSTSRVRAEISLNGHVVHTVYRDVVVNRPVITSITPPHGTLQNGRQLAFTVNHTGTFLTGSVLPDTGVYLLPCWFNNNAIYITFVHPGNYTISVTSTNACGSYTRHLNVTVTGNPLNPVLVCDRCGMFVLNCICHTLPPPLEPWREEEEEKVRIL